MSSLQHPTATVSLSVVIAAFNEVDNLEPVVRRTLETLRELSAEHEVIIVDDGSNDGTTDRADALAARLESVRVIHHGQNRGFGAALISSL